jgi:hypothetical protein
MRTYYVKQGTALYHLNEQCYIINSWWPDRSRPGGVVDSVELDPATLTNPEELCPCAVWDLESGASVNGTDLAFAQADFALRALENQSEALWVELGKQVTRSSAIAVADVARYAAEVAGRIEALRSKWCTQEGADGSRMRLIRNLQSGRSILTCFEASMFITSAERELNCHDVDSDVTVWARDVTEHGSNHAAKMARVADMLFTEGDPTSIARAYDCFDVATRLAVVWGEFSTRRRVVICPDWRQLKKKVALFDQRSSRDHDVVFFEIVGRYGIRRFGSNQAVVLLPEYEVELFEATTRAIYGGQIDFRSAPMSQPMIDFGLYTNVTVDVLTLCETAWTLWDESGGTKVKQDDPEDLSRPSQALRVAMAAISG